MHVYASNWLKYNAVRNWILNCVTYMEMTVPYQKRVPGVGIREKKIEWSKSSYIYPNLTNFVFEMLLNIIQCYRKQIEIFTNFSAASPCLK